MLCVKTIKQNSAVHGIGLFSDQDIPTGTVIWRFQDGFDQVFTESEIRALPKEAQIFLARHAYMSKKTGRFILDSDDGRYFNHSETSNSATKSSPEGLEDVIVAIKHIKQGEEITIDYANQEDDTSEKNILWGLYKQHNLVDEADPRLKNALKSKDA